MAAATGGPDLILSWILLINHVIPDQFWGNLELFAEEEPKEKDEGYELEHDNNVTPHAAPAAGAGRCVSAG